MGRVLRNTVIAGGVTYPRGTAETPALAERITNPRAWEGEPDPEPRKKRGSSRPPAAKAAASAEPPAPEAIGVVQTADGVEHVGVLPASAAAASDSSAATTVEEPPRGGAGATEAAWREYAAGLGIKVPEGAGRDDIVALVDLRGSDK